MSEPSDGVLPAPSALAFARQNLVDELTTDGYGFEATKTILDNVVKGLSRNGQRNFFGLVTGGVTPAARFADNLVTKHDQNVCLHLPDENIATEVEDAALRMLCNLLDLPVSAVPGQERCRWIHRIFTTGATASNVLGLACAREFVIRTAAGKLGRNASVAEHGIAKAMRIAELDDVQILTTVPHSSLSKAASIVGLGRSSVVNIGLEHVNHRIDMVKLASALAQPRTASIVAVSCSEVNTGLFATDGETMAALRRLCDSHGAWIHVDAAFGLLARVLPNDPKYQVLRSGVAKLELADSITGDAHKLLNVPYDCGYFFSRHLSNALEVFQNPNAAYLNAPAAGISHDTIPSPLNIGLENSRRFRALPVYASLLAYGRLGYSTMLERQIELARRIARFIAETGGFELLPTFSDNPSLEERLSSIYIVVIFRATNEEINSTLTKRINATREVYVSSTQWDGRPATRFAIATYEVDVERDIQLIEKVLTKVLAS